jgi:hypothetical protein
MAMIVAVMMYVRNIDDPEINFQLNFLKTVFESPNLHKNNKH